MPALRDALLTLPLLAMAAAPCLAQSGSFGNAVLVNDGELIIAEPNTYFRPGTVYVYRRSGGGWAESVQLRAPAAERADGFGAALAVTGNTLFVAQRGGRLHTFEKEGGRWRATGTLAPSGLTGLDPGCNQYGYCGTQFGIALAAAGDWLLVGEPRSVPGGRDGRGSRGGGADPEPSPEGIVYAFERAPARRPPPHPSHRDGQQ